jgi:hypothetical protein
MHNPPMPALRWALLATAVVLGAWFVLGAVQTRDQDKATALIQRSGTPDPALTARILHLLTVAGTLNPDRDIDLLRAQALDRAGHTAAAVRVAQSVARAEPQNANAWVVLGFVAERADPTLARAARARVLMLAPPVRPAP